MASQQSIITKLNAVLANQLTILKQEAIMAVDISALTAEVTNNTTVTGSVETLITSLAAQITALASSSTDPATQTALNALVATLQQNDTGLAAAVVANTPCREFANTLANTPAAAAAAAAGKPA